MSDSDANPKPANELGQALRPIEQIAALRIVDANANRAAEGLRVVEEYCRFVLDDLQLTRACKQLRHDLAETLAAAFPATVLSSARHTAGDVGTAITTAQENSRSSQQDIAAAGSKRVEQALRVLEEQAKLLALPAAGRFEQMRYRAYTLAKTWTLLADSIDRLAGARLYVLIDGRASEAEFSDLVAALVRAGVHLLQLRDKSLDDRTLLARARRLRSLAPTGNGPLVIVNDRPDIAVLADADGVHVGQAELSVRDVRRIVGPEMLVGVSTHTIQQAHQAVQAGANYIGCGPTFPSSTKKFDSFAGLDFLRQVAAEVRLPAFAIGGIAQTNLSEVLAAGFTRVAVSGSITAAANAEEEARLLLQLLSGKP